jgi:hypothetical protein
MQEAGLATAQGLLRIPRPAKESAMLMLRLRCYLPSTSAIIVMVAVGYLALHSAAGHGFAGFGLATEIVIALGLAGLTAGTIAISAVTIQRRRAAAGACHACSHPCRGAMVPSPEIDARRWPHRPLNYSPGGRPPVPPADEKPVVIPVPLIVVSARRDTSRPASPTARQVERVRA